MRSRWFHRPSFHSSLGPHKKVTWLELFYDLVFVAAIIQLGSALSVEVTQEHVTLGPLAKFGFLFTPLWVAWTGFTFFANRFDVDDLMQRALVFASMFAVGAMAIVSRNAFAGELTTYALAFALAQSLICAMYVRVYFQVPEARAYSLYWGGVFGVGTIVWTVSAFTPTEVAWALWALGLALILYSPLHSHSRRLMERHPMDMEHLGERYGLLTIIVLGESFVKVLSYLSSAGTGTEFESLLKGFLGLAITCSLWWLYFDDIAGAEVKKTPGAWIAWLYGHLPLTMFITAVGVAVKKTIMFDFSLPPDEAYRWLLASAVGGVFFTVAVIDSVTERPHQELSDAWRVNLRFTTGVVVVLLAQIGTSMSAGTFMALITAIVLAQVIFDMMMAPLEAHELTATPTSEVAELKASGEYSGGQMQNLSSSVRTGTPAKLRRDLYFFFMEGSWVRLIFTLLFVYIVGNVVFAAVYLLEPGSVTGVDNFSDAFFFSVQTVTTIGFGSLTPATTFGNFVVTVEAGLGILGVALATGLMFAKASRASSSVMFSQHAVVTTHNGVRTLMFRAGNTRGNEVVEATITVSAIIEEFSPEGHHMRTIRDLKLVRSRSPVFTLSWSVMHVIDKDSPLMGRDLGQDQPDLLGLIVTMMGYDGTYAQTTHARHMYTPDRILADHRFVDVISQLDDGRLMIDFAKFHDVIPDSSLDSARPVSTKESAEA